MTNRLLLVSAIFSAFLLVPISSNPSPSSSQQVFCWDSGIVMGNNTTVLSYSSVSDITAFQTWWTQGGHPSCTTSMSFYADYNPAADGNLSSCYTQSQWMQATSNRCPAMNIANFISNGIETACSATSAGSCPFSFDFSSGALTTAINGTSYSADCKTYQVLMAVDAIYLTYLAEIVATSGCSSYQQGFTAQTLVNTGIGLVGLAINGQSSLFNPQNSATYAFYGYQQNFSGPSISDKVWVTSRNTTQQATLLSDMLSSIQCSSPGNCGNCPIYSC